MSRQYLDETGLARVADKVKARLKVVSEMPTSADTGAVRLYIGETTASFTKGHIYEYGSGSWTDISPAGGSGTEVNFISTQAELLGLLQSNADTKLINSTLCGYSTKSFIPVVFTNTINGENRYEPLSNIWFNIGEFVLFYLYSFTPSDEQEYVWGILNDNRAVYYDTGDNVYLTSSDSYFAPTNFLPASQVSYSNTTSGLTAVTAQAAIDELDNAISGKQDILTFDSTPTSGSTNPVTSGGVYSYIDTMITQALTAGY